MQDLSYVEYYLQTTEKSEHNCLGGHTGQTLKQVYMDSPGDCTYKGSTSRDTVDAEPTLDMLCEQSVGSGKGPKKQECLEHDSSSPATKPKLVAQHGGKKQRTRNVENRKILIEMLLQSDLILQKALKLREESRLLLEDVSDDSHGSHL